MRVATSIVAVLILGISCLAAEPPKAKVKGGATAPLREKLDRGLIARPVEEGKVYLGWRLLDSDPRQVEFNVYRRSGQAAPAKLNGQPVRRTTDFVAAAPPQGAEQVYFVRAVVDGQEGPASEEVRLAAAEKPSPFRSIRLKDVQSFQKAGIADLDGDGRYDFVIKHPGANIDPWYKYWKPSPDTYKLDAYRHDGRFLWRCDLGWSIERGIWYSPYVVFDLDGDGRAEVAVKTGQGTPATRTARSARAPSI